MKAIHNSLDVEVFFLLVVSKSKDTSYLKAIHNTKNNIQTQFNVEDEFEGQDKTKPEKKVEPKKDEKPLRRSRRNEGQGGGTTSTVGGASTQTNEDPTGVFNYGNRTLMQ